MQWTDIIKCNELIVNDISFLRKTFSFIRNLKKKFKGEDEFFAATFSLSKILENGQKRVKMSFSGHVIN